MRVRIKPEKSGVRSRGMYHLTRAESSSGISRVIYPGLTNKLINKLINNLTY
jgi:hypothetical protein